MENSHLPSNRDHRSGSYDLRRGFAQNFGITLFFLLIIFVACQFLIMCHSNINHIISNTQLNEKNVENTPRVGHNQSANFSLSPPSPPRRRSRSTTLKGGLHSTITEKSSELPYFLSLDDRCHLSGSSPPFPFFTLKRRRVIEHTNIFEEDVNYLSYPRTTRKNKLQESSLPESFAGFVGLQSPR